MKTRSIGVIGCGVVGGAVAKGFEERGMKVSKYDKFKPGLTDVYAIKNTEAVFVCVPTATREDGTQDLEPLAETFAILRSMDYQGVIIVKSTVLPGTTKAFAKKWKFEKVCHNPEFLTAATPYEDFMKQTVVLIGAMRMIDGLEVAGIYQDAGFDHCKVFASPTISEAAKYMRNNFLATKVSFFNEQFEICQKLEITYDTVLQAMLSVGGIEATHTRVPGPDGGLGYAGMCFPKDSLAQLTHGQELGLGMEQLWGTVVGNKRRRPK